MWELADKCLARGQHKGKGLIIMSLGQCLTDKRNLNCMSSWKS